MTSTIEVVTLADARAFLWWANDQKLGIDPGTFVIRMIKAIIAADETNLEVLRVGYPGLVATVEVYRREVDWIGILQAIAREAVA